MCFWAKCPATQLQSGIVSLEKVAGVNIRSDVGGALEAVITWVHIWGSFFLLFKSLLKIIACLCKSNNNVHGIHNIHIYKKYDNDNTEAGGREVHCREALMLHTKWASITGS